MQISQSSWNNYIEKLSAINQKAATRMKAFMSAHPEATSKELIDYAYAIASRYGEASATLACEMYDATARAQGAKVPAAEPAQTATYSETGIAVNGAKLRGEAIVPQAVERLVKMAGQDTLLNNSLRDGAEWAWVPMGDTCAFCITLASRGWQKASKKAIKGGHAEHIHAHCDCSYAIRFDGRSDVEGYEPAVYRDMYYRAEGDNPNEKIKSLRRVLTEKQRVSKHSFALNNNKVDLDYIKSQKFRMSFKGLTDSAKVDDAICNYSRKILKSRSGTNLETLVLLDKKTGKLIGIVENNKNESKITYNNKIDRLINKAKENNQDIFAIHNHPNGWPPTADDCESAGIRGYVGGISVGHNGVVYGYEPSHKGWKHSKCEDFHNTLGMHLAYCKDDNESKTLWIKIMNELGFKVREVK